MEEKIAIFGADAVLTDYEVMALTNFIDYLDSQLLVEEEKRDPPSSFSSSSASSLATYTSGQSVSYSSYCSEDDFEKFRYTLMKFRVMILSRNLRSRSRSLEVEAANDFARYLQEEEEEVQEKEKLEKVITLPLKKRKPLSSTLSAITGATKAKPTFRARQRKKEPTKIPVVLPITEEEPSSFAVGWTKEEAKLLPPLPPKPSPAPPPAPSSDAGSESSEKDERKPSATVLDLGLLLPSKDTKFDSKPATSAPISPRPLPQAPGPTSDLTDLQLLELGGWEKVKEVKKTPKHMKANKGRPLEIFMRHVWEDGERTHQSFTHKQTNHSRHELERLHVEFPKIAKATESVDLQALTVTELLNLGGWSLIKHSFKNVSNRDVKFTHYSRCVWGQGNKKVS
ncbi:hypothetical protein TrST_g7163 [Triparma strigata]|uniref:Uncharacterized protein n=1 Tax=Triparma strigata TaxID=1606541 RepID=A0A9W7AR40_9STRA|nr:hypothetical protein TrST_g7163 [Triparma strigata]